MKRSLLPDDVDHFVTRVATRETPDQARLRAETAAMPEGGMQIGADQGALLGLLVRLAGARKAIEFGTFTGYSALTIAAALPPDGRLVACDVSDEWTGIARRHWQAAGIADRIELRLGRASKTVEALLREGAAGTFDFAFIDADKKGYPAYYEAALQLVRPGGLIALDNMLWSGAVADPPADDPVAVLLRDLALAIRDDARVDACFLTVGDGLVLARKRP